MQRYEKYKDSGVNWIGKIPEHWNVQKFKWLFREKKKELDNSLNCGAISFGNVIYKDDEKLTDATKKSYQVVRKNDFLLNPLNMNYDLKSLRIALSTIDVVVSSGYIVLQPIKVINLNYYRWLLRMYDIFFMKTLGAGVRQTINFNDLANTNLVFPPLEEQQTIATFLDDKIAKIDQTIIIKQKEIELLKERHQIVIQKAVIKGLNAQQKLKDSGLDWIGEIPKHWEVEKFKRIFSRKKKHTDISLPCGAISYGKVVIKPDEKILEATKSTYQVLNSGEFLINPLNLNYDLVSLRIALSDKDVVVSSGYIILQNRVEIIKGYYKWLLYIFDVVYMKTLGAGVRQTLNYHQIGSSEILIPPLEEQEEINSYLENVDRKVIKAISLKQQEIEKLKEYKTVLIDNVVTGKVKVI